MSFSQNRALTTRIAGRPAHTARPEPWLELDGEIAERDRTPAHVGLNDDARRVGGQVQVLVRPQTVIYMRLDRAGQERPGPFDSPACVEPSLRS